MPRIAGNQQADRHPKDDYPTDPRWTRALLRNVKLRGTIWEPAAGDGAIVKVLEAEGYSVVATDISRGEDFLTSGREADTIITNPPYRLLDRFIEHGLLMADETLCLLIGWHFLPGGTKRADEVWIRRPPNLVIAVPERMRHGGGQSSQYNHAWVVWDLQRPSDHTRLMWEHA